MQMQVGIIQRVEGKYNYIQEEIVELMKCG